MKAFSKLVITIFYIGLFPKAPGTVASFATILLWILFINLNIKIFFVLIVFVLFITSFYFIDIYLGDNRNNDPKEVVIDEVIGQSIPLIFFPYSNEIIFIFLIFIFFRFFDIFKVFPINIIDKWNGSKGIMLDDVLAGIYSLILISLISIIV